MYLFEESFFGFGVFFRLKVPGETPIQQRIIKTDMEPHFACGIHIFADDVPFRAQFYAGKVGNFTVEQTEPFVMTCCQHHIICAGGFGSCRPFFCTTGFGEKIVCQFCIFLRIDPFGIHSPFTSAEEGIKPEVNVNSESGISEPAYSVLIVCVLHFCNTLYFSLYCT